MRFSRSTILIFLLILFHLVGLVGIGFLHSMAILRSTPLHLLLMSTLLFISAKGDRAFYYWAAGVIVVGYIVEWIGVNTGALFGEYEYFTTLGLAPGGVPLVIGFNWLMVVAGAASVAGLREGKPWKKALQAAALATALDWIIEPVAIKLHYWHWTGLALYIPLYNYFCWFVISFLMALVWYLLRIRPNHFAVVLFLVQAVFFAILRLILP
jgi:putative membrane protein